MKRKLNVIIPVLLIFMGISGAESIQADEFTYTTTTNLNMRNAAGTGNRILLTVPKGKEVIFLGKNGAWYQVNYGGKSGYVSSTYVRKSQKSGSSAESVPRAVNTAKAAGTLNMITGPGTSYKKVGVIPKNTVVNYLGT